ncbi:MAG: MmcB family DNA repair protein [Clostridia bacterium]|nr:MmcB family DNA repair protein [Clostridia bacterium]
MLYDADIRDGLCLYLEKQYEKVRFFDELSMGRSRADLVMVTENDLCGIEIKSDADSYARLPRQIKDYNKYFDRNIIVIGSSHAAHAADHVPEDWGIIVVNKEGGGIDLYELRPPKPSGKPKLKRQLSLLWRRELSHIQEKNGLYKYRAKSRPFIEKYIFESVEVEKLKSDLIEELFERDYSLPIRKPAANPFHGTRKQ